MCKCVIQCVFTRLGTSIVAHSVAPLAPPPPHFAPFGSGTGPCWCCTDCRRGSRRRPFGWRSFRKRSALDADRAVPISEICYIIGYDIYVQLFAH